MFQKIQTRRNVLVTSVSMLLILLALFAFSVLFGRRAESKTQIYHSGDAASFNGGITAATTNSGSLEIFRYQDGGGLALLSTVHEIPNKWNKFLDVVLSEENGKLFAYATNGTHISKYDISSASQPAIVHRVKDNGNDWFMRLGKTDNRVISIGTHGVKIWNYDMQVVNGFKNEDKNDNVQFSGNGSYLFEIATDYQGDKQNDFVEVIDTFTRQTVLKQSVVLNSSRNRNLYYDNARGFLYIIGDRVVKKINLSDKEVVNYSHGGSEGFAVDSIQGRNYVYASNGVGITKLSSGLEALDSAKMNALGFPQGWAMHFRALEHNGKDRLVVFNNASIAVLDENLDLAASYKAKEAPTKEDNLELDPLAIALNTYRIAKGRAINVSAAGFAPGEEIELSFNKSGGKLGEAFKATADRYGRFRTDITAPSDYPKNIVYKLPVRIDMRVDGLLSERTISTALTVTE